MLSSILQTLSTGLADVLDGVMTWFLKSLNMDLGNFLSVFPLLEQFYYILRGFSVGMTAIIAGLAIAKFWIGSVDGAAQERPAAILVKASFAILAIYQGGYVLEWIVHLGKVAFDRVLQVDAVNGFDAILPKGSIATFIKGASVDVLTGVSGMFLNLAMAILQIALWVIIAWNLFKLVVEVCERWLMVGVLVYTSPLIYCTIPSPDTSPIFKKWTSMFVGSVIQMSLSVMFLKLILNGFSNEAITDYNLRLLLILAMCKIAQRIDTYLQQLGVGVASTGENLLNDIVGGAGALMMLRGGVGRMIGGNGGGSRTGILGRSLGAAARETSAGKAFSAVKQAWRSGGSKDDIMNAMKAGWANGSMKNSPVARGLQNVAKAKKAGNASGVTTNSAVGQKKVVGGNGAGAGKAPVTSAGIGQAAGRRPGNANNAKVGASARAQENTGSRSTTAPEKGSQKADDIREQAASGGFKQGFMDGLQDNAAKFANGAAEIVDPEGAAMRQEALSGMESENAAASASAANEFQVGNSKMSDEMKEEVGRAQESGKLGRIRNPKENFQTYGISDENGRTFDLGADGELRASLNNAAAGVSMNEDGTLSDRVGGDAVAENLAMMTSRTAKEAEVGSNEKGINQSAVTDYERSLPGTASVMNREGVTPDVVHGMAVSEGEAQVAKAKERVASLEASGISATAPEYQQAMAEYEQKSAALENYKKAYDDLNSGGYNGSYGMQSREQYLASETGQAAKDRAIDTQTVESYQADAAGRSDNARLASQSISNAEEKMRTAADMDERVSAMRELKSARSAAYAAAVEDGQQRVNAAHQELMRIESSGISHDSDAYRRAKTEYDARSEALAKYKGAYSRQFEVHAANDTYDLAQARIQDSMMKTIESADTYTLSRALRNQNYVPADVPATRRMAERVYADGIPDMKPESEFRSVVIRNLEPRMDPVSGKQLSGGRETRIEYVKTDGSAGFQSFYDLTAATQMPKRVSHSGHCVYTAPDGSMHLTTGSANISAPPSGKQVRMDKSDRNVWLDFMGLIKKDNRRRY